MGAGCRIFDVLASEVIFCCVERLYRETSPNSHKSDTHVDCVQCFSLRNWNFFLTIQDWWAFNFISEPGFLELEQHNGSIGETAPLVVLNGIKLRSIYNYFYKRYRADFESFSLWLIKPFFFVFFFLLVVRFANYAAFFFLPYSFSLPQLNKIYRLRV